MGGFSSRDSFSQEGASTARKWERRFLLGYLVIAVFFVGCFLAFVYTPINEQVEARQIANLTTTAQAQANTLGSSADAQAFVEAAVQGTDLRETLIAQDGTVVADSEMSPSTLANHLGREEVDAALSGTAGSAQRTSESDDTNRIYVAVPVRYEGQTMALRLSEPSTVVESITQTTQTTAAIIVVMGIVIIVMVAGFSYRESKAPLKKLDQVRSDFVANASHELKTPVAGIRLLSEAINDAAEINDKKSLRLFLDRLDNEAERLQRLVIDLLDLSRLEENPNARQDARTDLHSTLTTSFVQHKAEAEDKGIELALDDRSNPGDRCYANIEPSDASLIFDNLIENAIMYTDEGSILVTFSPYPHTITVSVKDTGIGIPQADQARIFERFYRVSKARSREVGGTGLGLSLVRHAVERGNGKITVNSVPDEGSEFTIDIPRAK